MGIWGIIHKFYHEIYVEIQNTIIQICLFKMINNSHNVIAEKNPQSFFKIYIVNLISCNFSAKFPPIQLS